MSDRPVIIALGRFGDVVNALPIAYALRAERPIFVIGKQWASILDGVSYVEPLVYDGNYTEISKAILWARRRTTSKNIIVAQFYMNPNDKARKTDSYQKESWRVAGWLDKFGSIPTVFDRRDPVRETVLCAVWENRKPMILVCASGISSPFPKGPQVLAEIRSAFGGIANIVDLAEVKAERIYDLIGLMDRAALVVSVDTVFLHLARAAKCPVIAITNDNWKGSVPPPSTVCEIFYSEADPKTVSEEILNIILFRSKSLDDDGTRSVIHVADMHGESERHRRAQTTWAPLIGDGLKVVYRRFLGRDSSAIGDNRDLPFLRDMLLEAAQLGRGRDIVMWTPSDVSLSPEILDWAKVHVGLYGAASMRRPGEHIGRDLFSFRIDWLIHHMNLIPDFYVGAPFFDLVLAAIIRQQRGIISTIENLHHDFYPCDATERLIGHEDHPSAWAGENEFKYPANLHNGRLAKEWCARNMPSLKL